MLFCPVLQHVCVDCKKNFCGRCSVQLEPRPRMCLTCQRFQCTLFERAQLMRLKVRELRDYLHLHEVPTQMCREKEELVELVLGQQTPPSSSSSSHSDVASAQPPAPHGAEHASVAEGPTASQRPPAESESEQLTEEEEEDEEDDDE